MSYEVELKESMDTYIAALSEYEKMVQSERYFEVISTMPFEFLNATQLCEKLDLYDRLEKKPHMYFSSLEEAKVFYKNLITFRSKSAKLLEDAAYMVSVGSKATMINEYVQTNPYLGSGYAIPVNEAVLSIAKKCLTEIPQYPKKLTKEFRWNFIESVILSLSIEDLAWMAQANIIVAEDLDHINLTETHNEYAEKISKLCEIFKRDLPVQTQFRQKLKGVTFPNDDGSSRQAYLHELQDYIAQNPNIPIRLTAESYIYTPEVGKPEPAIRILWNDKCIGNIAKDVVAQIEENYQHPQYIATLLSVYGGESNMSIGCEISLGVVSSERIKTTEATQPETEQTQ